MSGKHATNQKSKMRANLRAFICAMLAAVLLLLNTSLAYAGATPKGIEVVGYLYYFDEDSHYNLSEGKRAIKAVDNNAIGTFSISGNVTEDGEKSTVPAYKVNEGNLKLYYNDLDSVLLKESTDMWHVVDDKSTEVNSKELPSKIMRGAIIVQTSMDRTNWANAVVICDAFNTVSTGSNLLYTTTATELCNGCYYRVMVVYKLSVRIKKDLAYNYFKEKRAEVYEFYAYTDSVEADVTASNNVTVSNNVTAFGNATVSDQKYRLGEMVKVGNSGYYGEKAIDAKDIHYGWEIGNFYVSGYTGETKDADGNMVFLKNVGDKVTLWFRLGQDIDALNGDEKLSITADKEGSDQYFQTAKQDFGRGTLIIRYTDYNNVVAEPVIYTNYLEANTSVNADTKVQLFDEGDYEVALDYEVTKDKWGPNTVCHYRIFFKFSVRNGNCMVYPFDVETGSELPNSSLTENGFRLDLAKSRYLKILIKREVLKDSADGLVEDTRSNVAARDGVEYRDEGIYTITVSNEYTGAVTEKKIYVGTNSILKAYVATGLSIPEINTLVANGAVIADDGTIQPAEETSESPEPEVTSTPTPTDVPSADKSQSNEPAEAGKSTDFILYAALACGIVCVIVVCAIVVVGTIAGNIQRKKAQKPADDHHNGGGAEQ